MDITRSPQHTLIASSEWVTGEVRVDVLATPEGPSRLRVENDHFAPGARTHWHRHPLGQVLHITAGAGLVQRRGGPIEAVRTGDTVRIGPGEWHWHGAGPTTSMTHLSVQEVAEDGTEAERGTPVTADAYPTPRQSA